MKKIILATLILGTVFTAFAETIYHSKDEIFMNQAKFMNGVETDSVNAKSNLTFTSELDGVYNFDTTNRPTWQERGLAIVDDIQNGKLTIKTNGTAVGEFTANQSTDTEVDISIPAAQIQSDWDQIDNTKVDFIKHKPTILTEDDVYTIISNLVVNGGLFIDGVPYKLVVEYNDNYSRFQFNDDTTIYTNIVGEMPSTYRNDTTLTNIVLGNNVTNIGDWAFYNCSGLTSVTIPDSVTSIGSYAFSDCGMLTSVTIPDSITSIRDCVFANCTSLTNVWLGTGIESIGVSAFSWCSGLTSITIPNSVTDIWHSVFGWCSGLMDVTMLGKDTTDVQEMNYQDWGLPSGCKIHCTDDDITIP